MAGCQCKGHQLWHHTVAGPDRVGQVQVQATHKAGMLWQPRCQLGYGCKVPANGPPCGTAMTHRLLHDPPEGAADLQQAAQCLGAAGFHGMLQHQGKNDFQLQDNNMNKQRQAHIKQVMQSGWL